MAVSDALLLLVALWAAFSMRLDLWYVPDKTIFWLFVAAPLLAIPVFIQFGLYQAIVRYISMKAIWVVTQAVTLSALLWALLVFLSAIPDIPRSVTVINWMMAILLVGSSRMVARWWFLSNQVAPQSVGSVKYNVIIYGAGASGIQLATALGYSNEYRPVAFIDDNANLHGKQINALPVCAISRLDYLIDNKQVSQVLLAMPSASRARRKEIIKLLEPYRVRVKTLPGLQDIAEGKVKIEDIKDVDIEDLLGREHVAPRPELIQANVRDKVVMVTGAGGSIGSELCRQILKHAPKRLLLFEHNEYALYTIDQDLIRSGLHTDIQLNSGAERQVLPMLGTVLDTDRLEKICSSFGVQTIYHAAAYKHVPMVEMNPVEAVTNNIMGTLRVAEAAINTGVDTFVLISTDKAVRPTNTMGATKRFAELMLQALSRDEKIKTRFSIVRFGNVLGSSGSVIPLFRKQIQNGGPVTVTDPRIIRYFMTIPEAAELVIQAGAMGQGGDVFVLDMGEPIKILDLAEQIIHLSGLKIKSEACPDGDIEIKITGLRPGEKLYEELLIGNNVTPTNHPSIMCAQEEELSWVQIKTYLQELTTASCFYDQKKIRSILLESVKGFAPQCDIEDIVYKNR